MSDQCTIWLPDAKFTRSAGVSLGATLYRTDIVIGLSGELGAGKTTFLQGFLEGIGVSDVVASPTYALEQRYQSEYGEVLHLDLYRLTEQEAKELLQQSDEHMGIRCIEWFERANLTPDILIHLEESNNGRQLTVSFNDMRLPTTKEILQWRDAVSLPDHIAAHCDAVTAFAGTLAKTMMDRGIILRPGAIETSGLVHDLLRFVDFRPGAGHVDHGEDPEEWGPIREQYKGMKHEPACADWLKAHGYAELASIVAVHGLQLPAPDRRTTEQKLLFYADKRVLQDKVVSLEERFADFRERYSDGESTKEGDIWYQTSKELERELGFGKR